jgi:hypothetical protein
MNPTVATPIITADVIGSPHSVDDSLRLSQEVIDRLHESARLVQSRVDRSRQLALESRVLIQSLAPFPIVTQPRRSIV